MGASHTLVRRACNAPPEPAYVIFDFDGVVIDSRNLMLAALEHACRTRGIKVPPFERFEEHLGAPLGEIFRLLDIPLDLCDTYRRFCMENECLVNVFPEVEAAMNILRERGARLALNTGKDEERTLRLLRALGLAETFDHVVCSDKVSRPKPHPESIFRILSAWSIEPSRAAMVGDAPNDLRCAHAAGVAALWARWSHVCRMDSDIKPDLVFDSPTAFLSWASAI